jgi:hypothetical protein
LSAQEESEEKYSVPSRLKELQKVRQQTWADIALAIGLSEPMIYKMLKTGRCSGKTLYRLEMLEKESGIAIPPPLESALQEGEDLRGDRDLWRRRAKDAEQELDDIKKMLLKLAAPRPLSSTKGQKVADHLAKKIVEDAGKKPSA